LSKNKNDRVVSETQKKKNLKYYVLWLLE